MLSVFGKLAYQICFPAITYASNLIPIVVDMQAAAETCGNPDWVQRRLFPGFSCSASGVGMDEDKLLEKCIHYSENLNAGDR